jgi:small GTP-binding protein
MPANLPPQYFDLTKKLKDAKEAEEKISILEEMLGSFPKHKGTEKMERDLKSKIAKLKKKTEIKNKGKKIYTLKREGAGQIVILGPPNSGKTSLVNALTSANFKVADYPFTTTRAQPAMMPYQDILIQLVDTPPLTKVFSPGWLKEILKNANGISVVFDLSKKDLEKEILEFEKILKNLELDKKKILFVGNKIDLGFNPLLTKTNYKWKRISALKKNGLENLKEEFFKMLELVRVYSKKPAEKPDLTRPFTMKRGSCLINLVKEIHHDLSFEFKYARLFKMNSQKPIIVGKDYLLEDGDILEIHS